MGTQGKRGSSAIVASALTLVVLLAVLALAACGGSSSTASSSPSVAPSAVATASPQSTTAVTEFHGMLPCVWTQSIVKERRYRSTETVGDVKQLRHALWTWRAGSSDPRLSGRYDVVVNGDQRQADKSARLWGTGRLSNQGGIWIGKWTGGIAGGGDVHHTYGTLKGTGGYAGLVAHISCWFAEAGVGFTSDIQVVGAGWIETSDGSPVPPAPGPGTTPANWTPVVGTATLRDNENWTFDLAMSDQRVSGAHAGSLEEIGSQRADGSIDFYASSTLTNQDGAWDSPSGPINVRGPGPGFEHFMYWTSTGSGAYAVLTYHGFWHFMEPQPLKVGDTFVWTGFIEEAQ
jgi:hypothetical protein